MTMTVPYVLGWETELPSSEAIRGGSPYPGRPGPPTGPAHAVPPDGGAALCGARIVRVDPSKLWPPPRHQERCEDCARIVDDATAGVTP
jgi:hypothetical protein